MWTKQIKTFKGNYYTVVDLKRGSFTFVRVRINGGSKVGSRTGLVWWRSMATIKPKMQLVLRGMVIVLDSFFVSV